MFSCFTYTEEEEECDIILIDDLVNLTLSFLYECPGCKSCIVEDECNEVYDLDYPLTLSRQLRTNAEMRCSNCYREWRSVYKSMRFREIQAVIYSRLIKIKRISLAPFILFSRSIRRTCRYVRGFDQR